MCRIDNSLRMIKAKHRMVLWQHVCHSADVLDEATVNVNILTSAFGLQFDIPGFMFTFNYFGFAKYS